MLPSTVARAVESLPTVVRSGRRVNGLFRLMKASPLWVQAYQKIAPNKGAMTPGVDGKTLDGFSPEKVASIIKRLADGTYWPQPVRRVYIPKANGKKRPLGMPTTETNSFRKWCGRCWGKSMSRCSHNTLTGSDRRDPATLSWTVSGPFGPA